MADTQFNTQSPAGRAVTALCQSLLDRAAKGTGTAMDTLIDQRAKYAERERHVSKNAAGIDAAQRTKRR